MVTYLDGFLTRVARLYNVFKFCCYFYLLIPCLSLSSFGGEISNKLNILAKLQINTNNSMFGEIKKNNEVVNNMNTYFQKQFWLSKF